MIIVSNTSPLNYLILIGYINLLPELFQQIIIPQAVYRELSDASAPSPVQNKIGLPLHLIGSKSSLSTNLRMQFLIYSIPEKASDNLFQKLLDKHSYF